MNIEYKNIPSLIFRNPLVQLVYACKSLSDLNKIFREILLKISLLRMLLVYLIKHKHKNEYNAFLK